MLFRLHGNLHGDFTAATFQTIARLYCTCANVNGILNHGGNEQAVTRDLSAIQRQSEAPG